MKLPGQREAAATMAPALGLTSRILIALVQCWVAAIAPRHLALPPATRITSSASASLRTTSTNQASWSSPGMPVPSLVHCTSPPTRSTSRQFNMLQTRRGQPGMSAFSQGFPPALRSQSPEGIWSELQEASFNTSFTMSINRPRDYTAAGAGHDDNGGLLLEVLPDRRSVSNRGFDRAIYFPSSSATRDNISVEIGKFQYYYDQGFFGLYVSIVPPELTANVTPVNYTVWIEYNAKQHNLSVYADKEGKAKPEQASLHAPLNISAVVTDAVKWYGDRYGYSGGSKFGLFASKKRLLPSCQPVVYSWNLTVDRLSYISTSTSITDDRRRRKRLLRRAIVFSSLVLAAVAAAATVFLGVWCLVSRYRSLATKLKLSKAMRRLPGIPREFGYAAVKKATRNFHETMRLGSGGFGAVYKGAMIATCDGDDGRQRLQYVEVAVKKFTRKDDCSYDDFLAEVAVINRLRHRNIVPPIGWCYENGELLLIYQYMPNGSLDQHLFREKRQQQHPILQWQTRYDVIKDIAAGLHYVHHEYERAVLHRDIKASNIMLDTDFHGRLRDFGLARVVAFDKTSFMDMGVAGTWGFIAPECAVSHKATRPTDVYAFGVIVLEVVTGKRSLGAADSAFPLLVDWVWWLHGEGRLLEAVEDELTTMADFSPENATRLLLLGLACSDPNPSERPSMDQVVQVIAKSMPPPAVPPVKPAFVWPPGGEQLLLSDDPDDDDDDLHYTTISQTDI